jgi:L-cysteine desulfidase
VGIASAVQAAYLALEDVYVLPGSGLVGDTVEKTFANLGRMNREGMGEADRLLLALIREGQKTA